MAKTIIKELIILILLLAAVILGLGVLLYEYIPSNKVVPVVVKYETSSDIKEELSEKVIDEKEEVLITYEVDSKDLNIYEKTKQYNAGNPNPFSYYTTGTVENDNSTENNDNNNSNNGTSQNNNSNNNNSSGDEGTFFKNNKGTK